MPVRHQKETGNQTGALLAACGILYIVQAANRAGTAYRCSGLPMPAYPSSYLAPDGVREPSASRVLMPVQTGKIGRHFICRDHIGIFTVHIEQVDGMAGFKAIKGGFFRNDGLEVVGIGIHRCRPQAA